MHPRHHYIFNPRFWVQICGVCAAFFLQGQVSNSQETGPQQTSRPTYKKSWVDIGLVNNKSSYIPGDDIEVSVDYYLDPSEVDAEGTRLSVDPLGPYLGQEANPAHKAYPGLTTQKVAVEPGFGKKTFHFNLGAVFSRNSLNFTAQFEHANGQRWPVAWFYGSRMSDIGKESPRITEKHSFYELATGKPANLFLYNEPVLVEIKFLEGSQPGQQKELHCVLHDAYGGKQEGKVPFTTKAAGETAKVALDIKKRGIFVLVADAEDWGTRELVFARVPDVKRITKNKATPFGGTNLWTDRQNEIARMLGLTSCRHFLSWAHAEPAEGQWKLGEWDRVLEINKKFGIEPCLLIWIPPLWVMPDSVYGALYAPVPFQEEKWRRSARTLAEHFKGKIWGFEWLNEIIPGHTTPHPTEDYLKFCRIGTEAVKSVDPNYKIQLAGGLWPRNFRQDVLKAGVAQYVDVLPVHYSTEDGVRDAREDLENYGAESLTLWDNESAEPVWVWNKPWQEIIKDTTQPQWVLSRWPNELNAGVQRIFYFGGSDGGAAGGWNYLIDGEKPMPVAVTLSVLSSKLGIAKPIGQFYGGDRAAFYLFENKGKAVLVASSKQPGGESVDLDMGSSGAVITDYQGNETPIQAHEGKLSVNLGEMPVFIEGGNLQYLKGKVVLSVGAGRSGIRSRLIRARGASFDMNVEVKNPFLFPLAGTLSAKVPADWQTSNSIPIEVPVNWKKTVQIPVSIPANAQVGDTKLSVSFLSSNKTKAKTDIQSEIATTVIDPSSLGNLILNGNFEEYNEAPDHPASWNVTQGCTRQNGDRSLGIGNTVLEFTHPEGKWVTASQSVKVIPGQSYLYSAWIKTDNMKSGGGVNVVQHYRNGTSKTFYTNDFFVSPPSSPWRFYPTRIDASPETEKLTLVPISSGTGKAYMTNLRLTLYEGTLFAAEAKRIPSPIKIDGDISEWNRQCPIPILGDNQLSKIDPSYQWLPEKFSGVAYLCWDEKALYVAAQVRDDVHFAATTGDKTPEGDSMVIGIQPNKDDGNSGQASMYYISSANPGGGSGACTLYRPREHSGGLPSGQLARDSSVYDIAIKTDGNITTYELRIPWAELGNIRPSLGTKFGLSLQLNDNDGKGRVAVMTWGDGLYPDWKPAKFGTVTLLDQ